MDKLHLLVAFMLLWGIVSLAYEVNKFGPLELIFFPKLNPIWEDRFKLFNSFVLMLSATIVARTLVWFQSGSDINPHARRTQTLVMALLGLTLISEVIYKYKTKTFFKHKYARFLLRQFTRKR